MIFRLKTACVICVVILSHLRARRSIILPSSTNSSLNHLLSSIYTYVNHFTKTQSKFFGGTFYYFVVELFSSCVIVDGSRSRQVFGNLKVVMNASSKNQQYGCISEISSCIKSERMIVERLPCFGTDHRVCLRCQLCSTAVTRDELILLKRLLSISLSLSLSLSLCLDGILKQQLNIY